MIDGSIPQKQLDENEKLVSSPYVSLYEIKLKDGSFLNLKANNSITWNGVDWTGIPILFQGYSSSSADQLSRPSLKVANPNGQFSTFIRDGLLTRAVVTRYLVLYDDLINDNPVYQKKKWIVWKINSLSNMLIDVELRNPMDGVNFDVPARMYMPPEFPSVSL